MNNTYARQKLSEVRKDLKIAPGSSIDLLLINTLSALLPPLDEKLQEKYEITTEDKASLLLTERSEGTPAVFSVRLFFASARDLNYGIDQMQFLDGSGYAFSNQYQTTVTAAEMALYTDEDFYYADVTIYGETQFTSSSSLEWENAVDEFSHLLVTNITSSGNLAEDDDALESRTQREIALRNIVTAPGAEAWFFDNYPNSIRDTTGVGFMHDKMMRDVNATLGEHIGGHLDVYVKDDLPIDTTLKRTIMLLADRTWARNVSVAFMQENSATGDMYEDTYHKNMVGVPVVDSTVRVLTFAGTDYTLDSVTGIITHIDNPAGGLILCDPDDTIWAGRDWVRQVNHREVLVNGGFTTAGAGLWGEELFAGMFIQMTNTGLLADAETYLIISINAGANTFIVDRDLPAEDGVVPGNNILWRREPVSISFDYHPMGVELVDFENPLMWINSVTVLDPLTDEPLDPLTLITRKEGYGAGAYGAGPFGMGGTEGWIFLPDDENYRYSVDETGVLEFQGNFLGDRVEVSYKTSTRMAGFQTGMDANRSQTAKVLVRTYVPIGITIAVDVDAEPGVTEITGLDAYIWNLAGTMEISDIVKELYDLSATYVDLEDLISNTTLEQWNIDGTFTTITIPPSGQISITDPTTRFLPVSITVTVS